MLFIWGSHKICESCFFQLFRQTFSCFLIRDKNYVYVNFRQRRHFLIEQKEAIVCFCQVLMFLPRNPKISLITTYTFVQFMSPYSEPKTISWTQTWFLCFGSWFVGWFDFFESEWTRHLARLRNQNVFQLHRRCL